MASLRNIMNNVDDDEQPQNSTDDPATTSYPQHSSTSPMRNYTPASSNNVFSHHPSPPNYARGTSPHSLYLPLPDPSTSRQPHQQIPPLPRPLALPPPLPPGRQGSTGSEHAAYSHPHPAPYFTNHDIRSTPHGNPLAETGVKLTPITGRVSRAKKGVPVHTCDLCRPPKTFTRAEHLRRHQLSHQPPDLACSVPGCIKVFHRKDLLERHQQRHEQDERLAATAQAQSNPSPERQGRAFTTSSSYTTTPLGSYSNTNPSNSPSASSSRHDNPRSSDWTSGNQSYALSLPTMSTSPGQTSSGRYYTHSSDGRYSADSTPASQCASPIHDSTRFWEGNATMANKTQETRPDFYMSDSDAPSSPGTHSSSFDGIYSTSHDFSYRPKRARSNSSDWTSTKGPLLASPIFHGTLSSRTNRFGHEPVDLLANDSYALPGSEDDSSRDGTLLNTAPHTLPLRFTTDQSANVLTAMPQASRLDRNVSSRLTIFPTLAGLSDAIETEKAPIWALSQSVRDEIPVYLEAYFDMVHPMYPIIHRPSFEKALESTSTSPIIELLKCTMAAVATQYLSHEDHRVNGSELHSYAARKLEGVNLNQDWPLELMQAVMFSEYYMRFRGRDKAAYQTSALFTTLYRKVFNHSIAEEGPAFKKARPSTWREWIEDEAKQRLLGTCFLLDIHCMHYFERAPTVIPGLDFSKPYSLTIPLFANTTELWDAPTFEAWSKFDPHCERLYVGDAMARGLSHAEAEKACIFDGAVLLSAYSLQLPIRPSPTDADVMKDVTGLELSQVSALNMAAQSATASSYLAVYFTPLHAMLSVSGDSWLFSKKVPRLSVLAQQQSQMARWRESASAAAAATMAARTLVTFLRLEEYDTAIGVRAAFLSSGPVGYCGDISDFWAVYVCALICWSFGQVDTDEQEGQEDSGVDLKSRRAAVRWLCQAAKLRPEQLQAQPGRRQAQAVVGLARDALEREPAGGRGVLFTDALRVLRNLQRKP